MTRDGTSSRRRRCLLRSLMEDDMRGLFLIPLLLSAGVALAQPAPAGGAGNGAAGSAPGVPGSMEGSPATAATPGTANRAGAAGGDIRAARNPEDRNRDRKARSTDDKPAQPGTPDSGPGAPTAH